MKKKCWLMSKKHVIKTRRRRRSVSHESDSFVELDSPVSSNRRAKRRKLETSESDTSSSSSDTDPDTLVTPKTRALRSGVKVVGSSPPGPPHISPIVGKSAEHSQVKKRISKSVGPPRLTAVEARKIALEATREAKARRELMIGVLTDRIMSELINLGHRPRDIGHVCSEKFGWNVREWQDVLKEGKVMIYAPKAGGMAYGKKRHKTDPNGKKPSLGRTTWSAELEVDGLTLCIMKSGGTRVQFSDALQPESVCQARTSTNWDTISNYAELRCVFIHHDSVENFLSHGWPSAVDLTRSKPRIQLFTFGEPGKPSQTKGKSQHDAKVELILKAGAVIIPTCDSLFERPQLSDNDQREYYTRLQAACRVHPFLSICLHPLFSSRLFSSITTDQTGTAARIDCIMQFLTETRFDDSTESQIKPWSEWVKFSQTQICWLPQKVASEEAVDAVAEATSIVEILKEIRQDLFKEFRRFIIALPDNDADSRASFLDGIECMKMSHLCKLLKTDPF